MESPPVLIVWKNEYCEMAIILEVISIINVIPTNTLMSFLTERESNLKFTWKHERCQRVKENQRKMKNAVRISDCCHCMAILTN